MIPIGVLASSRFAPADGILASDTFTRADNGSSLGTANRGGTWATTGTWGILANRARCYGSGDTFATLDTGAASGYRAQVDMIGGSWPGLVLRYTDAANCYWLEYSGSTVSLWRVLGGTKTAHGSHPGASGSITVYAEVVEAVGETQFAWWTSANLTPLTFNDSTAGRPAGTRVGMRGQNIATRGEFDNFLVEEL